MASLRNLPLPPATAEEEKAKLVGGWDETIGDTKHSSSRPWERPSLSSHAMAHGSLVCGIRSSSHGEDWITWKTSFAPHRVCRVASNHDGSIVVAATDGGAVSLLRGRDGRVLATRRVYTSEGTHRPAEIAFVEGAHRFKSKDVLIILVPTSDQLVNDASDVNVILVSSIDGERLNDENIESVTEAAKSMSIDALALEVRCKDFEALQGSFLGAGTIRFAAGEADGNVSIHDYNVETKKSVSIRERIEDSVVSDEWTFLTSVGMRLQHYGNENTFLLLCGHSETHMKLFWYDLVHLNMACDCNLPMSPSYSSSIRPRVLSIEPVTSFSDESALAVAVAMKESANSSGGFVEVVQVAAEDTMGLAVLSRPHMVYRIPVKAPAKQSSLQGIGLNVLEISGPYSFRFQTWFGSDQLVCSEFSTQHDRLDSGVIGRIRLLLQQELYDKADELLASNDGALVSSDTFAVFHSSEVALRRLQRLLSSGTIGSKESMEQAQECLRRLIAGAVSSDETGQRHLLEAADSVSSWPSDENSHRKPFIAEYSMALSALITAIDTALTTATAELVTQLESKKRELEDRLSAMKCIEALVETDSTEIQLGSPFLLARSSSDLFVVLMDEGFFSVAEKFWRSEWGKELTAETLASSILGLTSAQDPRAYATLLADAVFPSLSINHEAVPLIRSWACRCADAFDEDETNEYGLEDSIFLLKVVLTGTQQLNLRIHSSFSSYSPFVERRDGRKSRLPSPRNSSLDSTTSTFTSEVSPSEPRRSAESISSLPVNEHPTPTVLELGFLKGGAMKSKLRSFPKRRSGDTASLIDDGMDDNEENVEIKLRHAKHLDDARRLGLPWNVISLRDYSRLGGTDRVAKELARIHSSTASTHEERYSGLTSKVKPFCDDAGVDFDQILVAYNSDICNSKQTSAQALLESSSIARCCCDPLVRCQVALAVLRAALLCGKSPLCLAELSKDAIDWAAVDANVKSELEEATRLLVVDEIVRKYCGPGARDLFRVDNPLHATRLLNFVCRHFRTSSVLSDALDLCDAFTYLTREEACILILERASAAQDEELCVELMNAVFALVPAISESVAHRVIEYNCHALDKACLMMSLNDSGFQSVTYEKRATAACGVACAIAETCSTYFRGVHCSTLLRSSFGTLLSDLKRIQRLQKQHGIFLSLNVFNCPRSMLQAARTALKPAVQAFIDDRPDDGNFLLLKAKGACAILSGDECGFRSMWYGVAGEAASRIAVASDDGRCVVFLAASGILDDFGKEDAVHAILSVALTLCRRASNETYNGFGYDNDTIVRMKKVIRASSLLHDYALIGCPERTLVALVSLGLLTETASQVLLRSDEGSGEILESLSAQLSHEARVRRHKLTSQSDRDGGGSHTLSMTRPLLHPSWYVGDGLLLPPRDCLSGSVIYCKDLLELCLESGDSIPSMEGPFGLHRFLGERGAHAVSLRILGVSTALVLCAGKLSTDTYGDAINEGFLLRYRDTLKCLGERSLGGSGNGITSVTIDSQLAATFLLSLPLKVAFKVYKAALPTAITKRDFPRVITLSNIGVRAGDGDMGWRNQSVFVSQCKRLSSRARWWKVLQYYRVDFDPSRFEDSDSSQDNESTKGMSAYAATLIPELISKASTVHTAADLVRDVATRFVTAFGLDPILAAQKHVEYLLSSPPRDDSAHDRLLFRLKSSASFEPRPQGRRSDMRWTLSRCERAARESLRLIPSPMKRSAVLRRCVIALENDASSDKDYERHAMVLSLYHGDLALVVSKDPTIRDLDASAFEEELELIERRRDALAILSSFFVGDEKPAFPKFFVPLPVPFKMERQDSEEIQSCDILGLAGDSDAAMFDPLSPLREFFSLHLDDAAATALAPLTIPLGLPHGSIHARCLIEQFRRVKNGIGTLPSFENDVLPVLNKLKCSNDQRQLAEWCATYYGDLDPQKLQCLDYGLRYAMNASSEVEKRLRQKSRDDDARLAADERRTLDGVKRLSQMHSALSDRLEVNAILISAKIGSSQQFRSVEIMVRDLMDRLQETFWTSTDSSPEKFVEVLLVEASLIASSACLDGDVSFSMSQFRHMCSVVHQACKKIADQYSHVHPGDISRHLARRWLVHGDEPTSGRAASGGSRMNKENKHSIDNLSDFVSADDDDTVNFVMDLKSLGETEAVWSDDIGSAGAYKSEKARTITFEEEPSALRKDGSSREASEIANTKVALRIAFVMSFAEGYHRTGISESGDEENNKPKVNSEGVPLAGSKKSRPGLLSRISTEDSGARVSVMEHARELLGIVFAKSAGSDAGVNANMSFLSATGSADGEKSDARKTLTFAMRYRALRSAAVLCPQVALDKVVSDEGYLVASGGDVECTLKKCAYGAFVAKEIEEMGLPLPHSDLVQLSTMHFPSYARALWRHHRDGDSRGKKGRLLLLLLEMSLKDKGLADSELTTALLKEMSNLQLPRTLLLGCECMARFKLRVGDAKTHSVLRDDSDAVSEAVFTAAHLVLNEFHRCLSSADSEGEDLENGLPTLRRAGNLVQTFSESENGQRQLQQFINVLVDLVAFDNHACSTTIADIALNAASSLRNVESRHQVFDSLQSCRSGRAAIQKRDMPHRQVVEPVAKVPRSALSELFCKVDASYKPSVVSADEEGRNTVCTGADTSD